MCSQYFMLQSVLITANGAWKLGGFGFAISSDQASAGAQLFHYAVSWSLPLPITHAYFEQFCFGKLSISSAKVYLALLFLACNIWSLSSNWLAYRNMMWRIPYCHFNHLWTTRPLSWFAVKNRQLDTHQIYLVLDALPITWSLVNLCWTATTIWRWYIILEFVV